MRLRRHVTHADLEVTAAGGQTVLPSNSTGRRLVGLVIVIGSGEEAFQLGCRQWLKVARVNGLRLVPAIGGMGKQMVSRRMCFAERQLADGGQGGADGGGKAPSTHAISRTLGRILVVGGRGQGNVQGSEGVVRQAGCWRWRERERERGDRREMGRSVSVCAC